MEEILVPVIDRVIELQPARLLDVGGFTYIDKDKSVTLFQPPMPSLLPVSTLSGFASLMEAGFEGFAAANVFVHVTSETLVELLATRSDDYGRREKLARALALKPERSFDFGTYMPQENFNIALRTMFVQDAELDALVQLAGNIAKQTEVKQEDDGFSQRVTAKGGVHLVRDVTVKPRVTLRPFRTFLEVQQPAGDYIFRVRHDEAKGNLCALFEADGGYWKLTAMNTIRDWLANRLKGSTVTGLGDIPVIA